MSGDFCDFSARIQKFMRRSLDGVGEYEREFNELALELYGLQRRANRAYARICEQRQVGDVRRWEEIPAVSTRGFKELEMTSLAHSERTKFFFSSGTTQQDRSRHFHSAESIALYEESLWNWFERFFGNERDGLRWLFLTPDAKEAPNSSLAHMFSAIAQRQHDPVCFCGRVDSHGGWELRANEAVEFLRDAQTNGKSVAVLGTAFLFVHFIDSLQERRIGFELPDKSWVMETGGYKGRSREIPKVELHRLISEHLGVPANRIFGEYGMSELSSQAYAGADGVFRFPPWARTRIISPATGRDADDGERGLIRVYDLANVWSVMAVQTEDVGIREADGFRLVGRAAEAEARGCSLMTV